MKKQISGFSKLSKRKKIAWLVENFFRDPESAMRELTSFWHQNEEQQNILEGFSENTISNFHLPWGVAPNFLINGKDYVLPMVTEESSVVAAASSAAKYWMDRGGIHARVCGTTKLGQVHFHWFGDREKLLRLKHLLFQAIREGNAAQTKKMEERGGGILDIELIDWTQNKPDFYQLRMSFETCDSMGANFINTVLENSAGILKQFLQAQPDFTEEEKEVDVLMCILSNYTPDCLVRAWVECPVEDLGEFSNGIRNEQFAERFCDAIEVATIDPYRAVTHNKGIFNGIDAVAIATGNDFRAIEACGHAYASRSGQYRSLSEANISNQIFRFSLELPLAVGTVGGLTKLHPIANRSLELLGHPSAKELMMILASAGLAQNFAAIRSLITTGIQQGHMKMHLGNILHHFQVTQTEREAAIRHFQNHTVSYSAVREFLESFRAPGVLHP